MWILQTLWIRNKVSYHKISVEESCKQIDSWIYKFFEKILLILLKQSPIWKNWKKIKIVLASVRLMRHHHLALFFHLLIFFCFMNFSRHILCWLVTGSWKLKLINWSTEVSSSHPIKCLLIKINKKMNYETNLCKIS